MPIDRRTLLLGASALVPGLSGARAQPSSLPTLRLGVLTDLSGPYRDNSGPTSVLAARQAVEDFAPERHGFHVDIIAADHQQKPDAGAAIARQWFDRDNVDAIADLNNTAIAIAVRTQAIEKDRALLISGAASADLSGKWCSPNTVHWAPDTYGDSHSTGAAILKQGGKTWFLLVSDYVFGHSLETEVTALVQQSGGRVLGSVAYPFPGTTDFSSYLLQAQSSGADVIALCNTGGDMENAVKQAHEFGLARGGKTVAPMFGFITEMKAIGLETAQGLYVTEPFYWDLNDRTRSFHPPLPPQGWRQLPLQPPRRRLQRRHPLDESRRPNRPGLDALRPHRHRRHEVPPHRRRLLRPSHHPRRRPVPQRQSFVPGKDPRREPLPLGPPQIHLHHPRPPSLPPPLRQRLPHGEQPRLKTVHNARVQLLANALNNVGVGAILAGVVAPTVAGTSGDFAHIVVWIIFGGDLIAMACIILGSLANDA